MSKPTLDTIVSLCKRRGFVFPGSEIYGGLANSWDFGPLGTELRNNIKQLWWKRFVKQRDDVFGLEAAIIMNQKVWHSSGHVTTFNDPVVEDTVTNVRYRLDHLLEEAGVNVTGMTLEQMSEKLVELKLKSPAGNPFGIPKKFNMMLETHLGPVSSPENKVYLRPETAAGQFVDFKNVQGASRAKVPFGIAQIGKAFRNEITPGNFIFRTREFEQMEIEYFIKPPKEDAEWQEAFEAWKASMISWLENDLKISKENYHIKEIAKEDLAHYSKRTIDFEYAFPFGVKELYGLAYRTDFDLKSHQDGSGQSMEYFDDTTNEKYIPHCIEPTWGVDRTFLAILCEHYREEGEGESKRVYLNLPFNLAPFKAAVFPLLKNKPELVAKAKAVYGALSEILDVTWDERGNVGKRYYSQDEIGTPFGITIDFQTLEDNTVTVRNRNTTEQIRVNVDQLSQYLQDEGKKL